MNSGIGRIIKSDDRALISFDGKIYFCSHIEMVSSCLVNVFYYPFDIQKCNISISSLIHTSDRLIVTTALKNGTLRGNGTNDFLNL